MEPAQPASAAARRRPRQGRRPAAARAALLRWARARPAGPRAAAAGAGSDRATAAGSGRAALLACVVVAAGLGAPGPSGAAPAARACATPHYPSLGYFDRITVTGVSCATGSRLAFAYYRCRTRTGDPAGRCPGGVLGFRCHEVRNASTTEIVARVTCRRGRKTVVHVYTQDLAG